MIRLIKHTIPAATALLMTATFAACSDAGADAPCAVTEPGSLTLYLATGGASSRADIPGSPDALSPATASERQITDLRYFAFPTGDGRLIKGFLTPPTPEESAGEQYKTYTVKDVDPGSYRVYVVANMPQCSSATTEDDLRNMIISYGSDALPVPGKLPMIHEPAGDTEVKPGGTQVIANLHFTCVKVRYNIIFDPAQQNAFGNWGLMITDINGLRLSESTPLALGGPMSGTISGGTFDTALPAGRYHAGWSRNDHADADEDVIVTDPDAGAPGHYADRWVYQGTLYLPERYVASDADQSAISVTAITVDDTASPLADGTIGPERPAGPKNTYTIPLGHTDTKDTPRQFPRGTYYEIIARITDWKVTELETEVRINDWIPVDMAGSGHTTLTVDKTRARVTSLEQDRIGYSSSTTDITMGCDETLDGKPVIVQSAHNPDTRIIEFGINPDIPISMFREDTGFPPTGTTTIWIQAGNIRKYLDVDYNVEPLFEITPRSASINWLENIDSDPTYTKTFSFRTNLGGIAGMSFPAVLTVGASSIRVECTDPEASSGTFTVTALNNPGTTTEHSFTLEPHDTGFESMARELLVTVKPPVGDYRIYFRAINDQQGYNDALPGMVTYNTPLREGDGNWQDGWDGHSIYCYTQVGETVNGNIPEYYVWKFTGEWPGRSMTADGSNSGWYYSDFSPAQIAVNTIDGSQKTIKPGETLFMFNTGTSVGAARHRCTHHMDPGIQLFDYEDREGWVIYDPLCDPYYKVYDNRPRVVNVNYIIYTPKRVKQWYNNYGHTDANTNGTFCLGNPAVRSAKETIGGTTWYHTQITLKCTEKEYAKTLTLLFEDNTTSMLFGGANYYDASNPAEATGMLSGSTWTRGRPVAATKRIFFRTENTSPHIHAFILDGLDYDTWPGVPMAQWSDGWWYYDLPVGYNRVMFTDGAGNLTSDFASTTTSGNQYFDNGGSTTQRP